MAVSADSLRLAIVPETVPGTTPPTPAFLVMPATGEGLSANWQSAASAQLGGVGRGVRDQIITGFEATGPVNFELLKDASLEAIMSSMFGDDWVSDEVVVGEKIKTFTVEKRFTTDSGHAFQRYTGAMVDTFSLSIAPGEAITGSAALIAADQVLSDDAIVGATYSGPSITPVMRAPNVTAIELIDPATSTPYPWVGAKCFTQLDITFGNNARALSCIGKLGAKDRVLGQFTAEMSFSLYFTGNDVAELMRAQSEFGVRIRCEDGAGAFYEFNFPRCKLGAHTSNAGGTGQDVLDTGTITALMGAGATPWVCKITRGAA